jgi:hypothetical protein
MAPPTAQSALRVFDAEADWGGAFDASAAISTRAELVSRRSRFRSASISAALW